MRGLQDVKRKQLILQGNGYIGSSCLGSQPGPFLTETVLVDSVGGGGATGI